MSTVMVQDEREWKDTKDKKVVVVWRGKAKEYSGDDLKERQEDIEKEKGE